MASDIPHREPSGEADVRESTDEPQDVPPPPHSEAFPPDLQAHLVAFLRSFLKDELPDLIGNIIHDKIGELNRKEKAPLDTKQACRRLNISRRKLDELVAAGKLRPIRIGRKRLFPEEQLDAFLRQAAKGGG